MLELLKGKGTLRFARVYEALEVKVWYIVSDLVANLEVFMSLCSSHRLYLPWFEYPDTQGTLDNLNTSNTCDTCPSPILDRRLLFLVY